MFTAEKEAPGLKSFLCDDLCVVLDVKTLVENTVENGGGGRECGWKG